MTNKQSEEDGTLSDDEINWLLRRAEGETKRKKNEKSRIKR